MFDIYGRHNMLAHKNFYYLASKKEYEFLLFDDVYSTLGT